MQVHLAFGSFCCAQKIALAGDMGERDVAGLARLDAERYANQIGAHFVEAGGFGVDGDPAAFADFGDPSIERRRVRDHLVFVWVNRRIQAGIASSFFHRRGGCVVDGWGLDAKFACDAVGDGAELHFRQKREQFFCVRFAVVELFERGVERRVLIEKNQLAANADLIGVINQGLAALGLFDLFGPLQKRVQIAVFVDQQRCGFHADAGRAGDVIDAIACERLHIDHPIRADTKFLFNLFGAYAFGFHGVIHLDATANELHEVFVRGHDRDATACIAGLHRIGGDDVVCLEAFGFDAREIEGACRRPRKRELRAQIFGRRWAVGFVFGVDIVAKGLGGMVEDHRDMGGRVIAFLILDHLEKHVAKARHSTDRQAI